MNNLMNGNHLSSGGALVIEEDVPEQESTSASSSSSRPLKRRAVDDTDDAVDVDVGVAGLIQDSPSPKTTKAKTSAAAAAAAAESKESDDRTSQDYYFDSYAHHAIHEEMLKDHVRTQTYQMAITQNAHLFRDKVVLDVGCGTAILSLFCCQAGAKHVYAVDCSSILQQAKKIVHKNGYSDKITLIQGKIEEIELPVEHVDIIVSEWMGYFLLYESMLDTVIFARDKWLVKDNTGIIFPDKAVMYLSAMEDENIRRERIDFWDDVYGFDMSPIKEIALREPVVDVVDPKSLVTDAVPILHLDILTCTKEDLAFTADFKLQARRNDFIHGLVAYFECAFTQIHKPIGFSTAPFCRYTHWKQTMFYVPDTVTVCAGETLHGQLTCKPNHKNKRDLDIAIAFQFQGKHSTVDTTVEYRLR
eukprot:CAMPEP_0198139324 /NCGR_PEP_ID=MMETSP1443-20131203/2654_1 /TAXON_ID=186043 /ORGANISM="Entomoneis sp., Strain CCMP2396" /LENGTH=416 /DNA_ID=CAMNT_0043801429 /DNA_START=257 /DNA_END=1507 /DNA_ORIENTATION=-